MPGHKYLCRRKELCPITSISGIYILDSSSTAMSRGKSAEHPVWTMDRVHLFQVTITSRFAFSEAGGQDESKTGIGSMAPFFRFSEAVWHGRGRLNSAELLRWPPSRAILPILLYIPLRTCEISTQLVGLRTNFNQAAPRNPG